MWWRNYSRTFSYKIKIKHINILNQYSKILHILFLLFAKLRTIKIDCETKLQTTCFCFIKGFIKKQKEVWS